MHQPTDSAAATAIPVPAARQIQQNRGSPPGSAQALNGASARGPAEATMYLAEDYERIAQSLNDVVIRRLFAASLDLEAALGLIGDHPATGKIYHAVDELDLAVRDIRDTIFGHRAGEAAACSPLR